MKRFVVVTNRAKDPDGKMTAQVREIIEQHGGVVSLSLWKDNQADGAYDVLDPDQIPEDTELVISLGGDGSFLHTAKDLIDLKIPVMGVNLGTLGYLTEMDLDGFREEFVHILNDEYHIDERILLEGQIIRNGRTLVRDIALNDIVLNRLGTMNIIHFDIMVNGRLLNSYNADGYILCTPTGSTGYNLSAGGPVAHPVSEVIIATPICEHTLNSRSVVFSADAQIDVVIRGGQEDSRQVKALSFDGDREIILQEGDIVKVSSSDRKMYNLRLDKMSFVEHLGRKMR